jgi:hypothetical protein
MFEITFSLYKFWPIIYVIIDYEYLFFEDYYYCSIDILIFVSEMNNFRFTF